MIKTLLLCGLASTCFASIWNPASNFNAPNNPDASSAFSYGVGATPGGFTALGNATLDCQGSPTYCLNNGVAFPGTSTVVWNGTAGNVSYATIVLPSTMVAMDPQTSAGTILRFIAPWTDTYSVTGSFEAIDTSHHTTTGEIWVNSSSVFGPASVLGYTSSQSFNLSGLSLTAGDTIDFIVVSASDCCFLSTGLAATITSATTPVPEPGTILLAGGAILAAVAVRRRTGSGTRRTESRP